MRWREGEYLLSDDRDGLDLDVIHGFLSQSYWAKNIPRALVQRSLDNSLCFGLFHAPEGTPDGKRRQAGFCRAVTDRATFAYLADVFVLPEHRGRGLGAWMVGRVLEHPDLTGLRRFLLATLNTHGLYAKKGFAPLGHPEWYMEILGTGLYPEDTEG